MNIEFNAVDEARVCGCGQVLDANDRCVWCEIKMLLHSARENSHPAYAASAECEGTVSISFSGEDE